MTSVFAKYDAQAFPFVFEGTLHVKTICGGVPSDPRKAEGWIRSKLQGSDDLIKQMVAETMVDRGVSADEAAKIVDDLKNLNGFKVEPGRGLYIEGRQLKAGIKEAANVRWPNGRWSFDKNRKIRLLIKAGDERTSGKATTSFISEHVFVREDRLYLGVTEPTGVIQQFVHTFRGDSIQYIEYCEDVNIDFSVETDVEFTDEQWALLWLTAQREGLGAARSQGYGRYEVTRWESKS